MNTSILFISVIISVSSAHAAIYRSVDAQGNPVFSDQPSGDAQPLKLPPVTTYSPPPKPAAVTSGSTSVTLPPAPGYQQFAVVAPGQDQAFWDNAGDVEVRVSLQPALMAAAGHRLVFYLDGVAGGAPVEDSSTVFHNVDRGQHTVSAAIIDATGQTVQTTEKVRFQLHRLSLNSPLRNNSPPPTPKPNPKPAP
jgi:Domain of unknown function (DUF4124)